MVKNKQEQRGVVIPLQGYLQGNQPPTPTPAVNYQALGLFPIAIALVLGLVLGGVSVHNSAGYQEMQQLKTKAAQLQNIKKQLCN